MTQEKSSQNIIHELLATVKAVSGKDDIKIEFSDIENNFFRWNQNLIDGDKIILPRANNLQQARAAADLASCYLLFHNKKIHNIEDENFSLTEDEKNIYDGLERMRVTAGAKDVYLGVVQNILQKIVQDKKTQNFSAAMATQDFDILLAKEIFANFKERVQGLNEVFSQDLSRIESDKKFSKFIKNLAKNIENQQAFALEVKRLFEFLRQEQRAENSADKNTENQSENSVKKMPKQEDENFSNNEETPQSQQPQDINNDEENSKTEKSDEEQKINLQEGDALNGAQAKLDMAESNEEGIEFKKSYKIYTSKFDEIVFPQKLISKSELELLRHGLELRLAKLTSISKRLTIKLKKKLMAKKNSFIEQSNSEGILDRKKFTQMVIDPFSDNHFIVQKQRQYQDTVVSILLDNSGSMRGQPIIMSALACEIIAKILEKFSIKTEILGFTTVDWKGGKSRKLWESEGRSHNPGRLSDLRHIVYKSANQSLKKSQVNLGLMLKEGMLKENIDGEALLWAKGRLLQRDEKRKILAIISDGTPVDDSTNSTNDQEILTDHLRHVIHRIEKQTAIEVFGIGIGHQVSNFYRNSIAIKNAEELGDVMIEKITKLM